MNKDISLLAWPLSRLGESIEELARFANLNPATRESLIAAEPLKQQDIADLDRWIEWAGDRLGIEAEPIETSVSESGQLLRNSGPALLQLGDGQDVQFLLLLKSKSGMLQLIGPDLCVHSCPAEVMRAALCERYEAPVTAEIDRLLVIAGVPRLAAATGKIGHAP